jgi:hypothetical protein
MDHFLAWTEKGVLGKAAYKLGVLTPSLPRLTQCGFPVCTLPFLLSHSFYVLVLHKNVPLVYWLCQNVPLIYWAPPGWYTRWHLANCARLLIALYYHARRAF